MNSSLFRWPICRQARLPLAAVVIVLVSLLFEVLGQNYVQSPYLPVPSKMLITLGRFAADGQFHVAVANTLGRLFLGYVLAGAIGTFVGVMLGINSWLHSMVRPLVEFLRPLPVPAIMPLATLILGFGDSMRVAVVIFACVWPIFLAAMDATADLDNSLMEVSATLHVQGLRKLVMIIFPAITPRLLTGGRLSISIALIAVLLTEMTGRGDGLGGYLVYYQRNFAVNSLYTLLIVIALLGRGLNAILALIETHYVKSILQPQLKPLA